MGKFREKIHSREVTTITGYENMDATDRGLFFKAYKFDRFTETYSLINPELVEKISNKEKLIKE